MLNIHEKQLELLEYVHNQCVKHDLIYYLFAGTLLGAIRHKGFIPWDKDLDVALPRNDYEKLISYIHEDSDNRSLYFLGTYKNQKDHYSPHAILYLNDTVVTDVNGVSLSKNLKSHPGVYIDIFPLDNGPDNIVLQKRQAKKLASLKRLMYYKKGELFHKGFFYTAGKKTISFVLKIFPLKSLMKKIDKEMTRYNCSNTNYLIDGGTSYTYERTILEKSIYGQPIQIEFENKMFFGPQNPASYLKKYYGDYMKQPSTEHINAELSTFPLYHYSK